MAAPYSYDLREKVLLAIQVDKMGKTQASRIFNISRNTIDLWLKRQAETGDFKARSHAPKQSTAKIQDLAAFRVFVDQHGDKTQTEMALLWSQTYGVTLSATTIGNTLRRINVTRKKKTYGYQERKEEERQEFCTQLEALPEEDLVYIDESGMDSREDYEYGYNEKGKRYHALRSGKHTGRINMIAALCTNQLLAPFTMNGSCTREVFEIWLEKCLLPELKPGQVLILDNARFHKGGRIKELVAQAGCRLMYLPAYSPDLNKIENCWSWLKSRIRKRIKDYGDLRNAMEAVLKEAS